MNPDKSKWSRREFSKAIISAQLLIASGALAIPLSCIEEKPKSQNFDDVLKLIMDELIPDSEKMPAASKIGFDYLQEVLNDMPDIKSLFELALQTLEENSQESFKHSFLEINKKQRIELLSDLELNHVNLFTTLRNFTNESYYLNESIWPLIGYEPHTTGTLGPKMDPFNESLLDRVKITPPFYTNI